MSAASDWLSDRRNAHVALALEVEGVDLVLTTATHDVASMKAAWTGSTDWTNVKTGLDVVGEVESSIEPFDPTVSPQTLTFTFVDHDGTVTSLLKGTMAAPTKTRLSASIDCDAGAPIVLQDVTGFSSSSVACVGTEAISYDAVEDGGLGGTLVRGVYSPFGCGSGTRRGQAHTIDVATSMAPRVSTLPTTHVNRIVSLWVTVWDGARWTPRADARRVWSGRVKAISDDGTGKLSIECRDLTEMANKQLFSDQLVGTVERSLRLGVTGANADGISLRIGSSDATPGWTVDETTTFDAGVYTVDSLRDALATKLQELVDAAASWPSDATIDVRTLADGRTDIVFMKGADDAYDYGPHVKLSMRVWRMLGYDVEYYADLPSSETLADGNEVWEPIVEWTQVGDGSVDGDIPNSGWHCTADHAEAQLTLEIDDTFTVDVESGAWHSQALDGSDAGYLMIDRGVFWVTHNAGVFTIADDPPDGDEWYIDEEALQSQPIVDAVGLKAKQVVASSAPTIGALIARVLCSTGTSAYNSSYDVYPASWGCVIPSQAVDLESLEGVGRVKAWLIMDAPTKAADVVCKLLALSNSHLVLVDGVITAVNGVGANCDESDVVSLSWADDAGVDASGGIPTFKGTASRTSVDNVVNSVTLNAGRALGGEASMAKVVVENAASRTDLDCTRGVEFDCDGVKPEHAQALWATEAAAEAISTLAWPWTIVERPIDFGVAQALRPGKLVYLTDPTLIDPNAGTRGVVDKECWVVGVSFDWGKGCGVARLAFCSAIVNGKLWAPSALVDWTQTNGGYDAANKRLTCVAHGCSLSSGAVDVSNFAPDDVVSIRQLSSSTTAKEWTRTVASVDAANGTITLTAVLDGTAWSSSLRYVVTLADSASATAESLLAHTFVEAGTTDDDDDVWSTTPPHRQSSEGWDHVHVRSNDSGVHVGSPLPVHVAIQSQQFVASWWNSGTSPIVVNSQFSVRPCYATAWECVYGPIRVPVTDLTRGWELRALAKTSAGKASSLRLCLGQQKPTGGTMLVAGRPGYSVTSDTIGVTNTAADWLVAASNPVPPTLRVNAHDCVWLWVEGMTEASGTLSLYGVCVREVPL